MLFRSHHPDVKRMLLTMKSQTEALRAVALHAAWQLDLGAHHPDASARAAAQARGDLLIPLVKGCSTEAGIDLASLGIQIHGGMGFVEETGAAQPYRDVRITTIYEGTTGIQSNDFVGRKIGRDRGAALAALVLEMRRDLAAASAGDATVAAAAVATLESIDALEAAARKILESLASEPARALAVSVPFMRLAGHVVAGWQLVKAADVAARRLAAEAADRDFLRGKIASAAFHVTHVLPQAHALARVVEHGANSVLGVDVALF